MSLFMTRSPTYDRREQVAGHYDRNSELDTGRSVAMKILMTHKWRECSNSNSNVTIKPLKVTAELLFREGRAL